jgi:hypothetical protein
LPREFRPGKMERKEKYLGLIGKRIGEGFGCTF